MMQNDAIRLRLERIERLQLFLLQEIKKMSGQVSANFTALANQVNQNTSVEQSAVTLINGLAQQLQDAIAASNNGDTNALPNLAAELATSGNALAAAVAANTPQQQQVSGAAVGQGTTAAQQAQAAAAPAVNKRG